MEMINELMTSLRQYFPWNKARLYCLSAIIIGLFKVRTVNLQELATAFPSAATISSRYRRLQRFFALFKFDYTKIAQWSFQLFFATNNKKVYLTIDRTNWFWGKSKINIFMLAAAHEGIAIPLFWNLLGKAGSSNGKEQIALLDSFVQTFGKERIAGVLADREFPNKMFIAWLVKPDIPFYFRIKGNNLVRAFKGKKVRIDSIFKRLKQKKQKAYVNVVELFGQELRVAGSRSKAGTLMIVVTNRLPDNAIAIYCRRWEIESLFQSLKGRGFHFEETHMTSLERIKKLTAILSLAFCWAHKVGEWRSEIKPIRFNHHKESIRPQNSYFRYGFDWMRDIIFQVTKKWRQFKCLIKQLEPPNDGQIAGFGYGL